MGVWIVSEGICERILLPEKKSLFPRVVVKGSKILNLSNTMPQNYLHLAADVVDALGRAENN
jgi:hypothetical protein